MKEQIKEDFLKTSVENQREIIRHAASVLNRSEQILEKDIWICLVLEKLFSMPEAKKMAFKGGTSLSKAYNLINRFSEDVDVTIDYREFIDEDPFAEGISRTKQKKISDQLKSDLNAHIKDVIHPYLQSTLATDGFSNVNLEINLERDQIEIQYQPVSETLFPYIKNSVMLEFGARNITEPNKRLQISPYVAEKVPALRFPVAWVDVLEAERTFWEKVTLIHVECNRGRFKQNASRLSRHWYDLAMMAQSDVGASATEKVQLLHDVIKHKKVFFNESCARYDECLSGKFNLIPQADQFDQLRQDYGTMIVSNMFYGTHLAFKDIIEAIRELSDILNKESF